MEKITCAGSEMKSEPQLRNLDQRSWLRKIRSVRSIDIKKRYLILILALIILASYQVQSQSNSGSNGYDLVDKAGILHKPPDYRDRYQALGVFSVADLNGAVDLHYTYAPPGDRLHAVEIDCTQVAEAVDALANFRAQRVDVVKDDLRIGIRLQGEVGEERKVLLVPVVDDSNEAEGLHCAQFISD